MGGLFVARQKGTVIVHVQLTGGHVFSWDTPRVADAPINSDDVISTIDFWDKFNVRIREEGKSQSIVVCVS